MRGHVAKKRNRWFIVVDVGTDSTGKRKQRWHSGNWRTKAEAEKALPKLLSSLADETYVAPDRATVRGFIEDEWLPAMTSVLRPSTHALYTTLARAYIYDRIGTVSVQKLKPSDLNRLYAALQKDGRRDGKPLAAETTAKVHRLLHRVLRDAVRWDRVPRNVAALADPPRAPRSEMRAWESSELAAFLRHVSDDEDFALWILFATTGLRRAEALGLRWCDLDLERKSLSVRQTIAYVGTVATVSEPKTSSSRRMVMLPAETVEALRAHRARQAEQRLSLGTDYDVEGDLVFAGVGGTLRKPATVSRRFERLAEGAGLPRITLHGLRHSWASAALLSGVPSKVVAEILGHSSTRITEDLYQHVTPGMQADATDRVAALFREAR